MKFRKKCYRSVRMTIAAANALASLVFFTARSGMMRRSGILIALSFGDAQV
jgi:hypothetical protein